MKRNNKKGFTLAELLIVVAIIAVLVAIAIPVFTAQLERAREATDMANIRNAYAEATVQALTEADGEGSVTSVKKTQATSGWTYQTDTVIGGKYTTGTVGTGQTAMPDVDKGDTVTVTVDAEGNLTIAATAG